MTELGSRGSEATSDGAALGCVVRKKLPFIQSSDGTKQEVQILALGGSVADI